MLIIKYGDLKRETTENKYVDFIFYAPLAHKNK